MSDDDTLDLERASDRAWRRLRRALARHLSAMDDDDTLVIDVEAGDDDEVARYVQLAADGDRLVLEVSSNEVLTGVHRLAPADEAALASMGLAAPSCAIGDDEPAGSPNHHLEMDRSDARRLAGLAVRALRDVLGVPHPAFLAHPPLAGEEQAVPPPALDADGLVARMPASRAHLQAMVDEALTPLLGQPPEHDEDDDVVVPRVGSPVFVRVLPGAPIVQLVALLVDDVADGDRADFEIGVIHREHPFLRLILSDAKVLAYLNLQGQPFLPAQFRAMFEMINDLDDLARDLAHRVGGIPVYVSWDEHHEAEWEAAGEPLAHPALRTIRELEGDEPGSVDAELAASICDHDRDVILEQLDACVAEREEWFERIDDAQAEGDEVAVERYEQERAQAERMAELLRRALRVVVEAERRPHRPRAVRRHPPEDDGPTPTWLETG